MKVPIEILSWVEFGAALALALSLICYGFLANLQDLSELQFHYF